MSPRRTRWTIGSPGAAGGGEERDHHRQRAAQDLWLATGEPDDGMDWIVSIEPYQPEGWLGEDPAPELQPYRVTAVASLLADFTSSDPLGAR